jgi:hypothetical protein
MMMIEEGIIRIKTQRRIDGVSNVIRQRLLLLSINQLVRTLLASI